MARCTVFWGTPQPPQLKIPLKDFPMFLSGYPDFEKPPHFRVPGVLAGAIGSKFPGCGPSASTGDSSDTDTYARQIRSTFLDQGTDQAWTTPEEGHSEKNGSRHRRGLY